MIRQCGDCQLCCRLLAVPPLGKKAGEKCQHQKFKKGCAVYHTSAMPNACSVWNCRWLVNDDMDDQSRPDRSHVVVDIMPDFITAQNNDTGEEQNLPVIQVWVDPKYPGAHRDPAIRAYLDRQGYPAIIRYDAKRALVVFPPSVAPDGEWHEMDGQSSGRDHSGAEIIKALEQIMRQSSNA